MKVEIGNKYTPKTNQLVNFSKGKDYEVVSKGDGISRFMAVELIDDKGELTSFLWDSFLIEFKESELSDSPSSEDIINKSPHYNNGIETIDYIESHNMGFHQGNVIKYVTRYKHKGGVEDLKKAKYYLERLIANEEGVE